MGFDIYQPLVLSGGVITQNVSGTALKLLGADADILTLGDATHEGGDLEIYRNAAGDLALSLDADAASNAIALSVYGGVVAQNYLTVGQAALNNAYCLYISGTSFFSSAVQCNATISVNRISGIGLNAPSFSLDFNIGGTDSTDHIHHIQANGEDIITAKATGNGSGGITNKAIGLYGTTPTTQAAHIADPAENVAANNAAIDAILVALENIGITASA